VRKLLLRIILEKAIAFEENAYRYYEEALERTAMIETAELLRKLLSDELRHRLKLEEMQRTGDIEGLSAPESRNYIYIKELREKWPLLHPWSSRAEILKLALKKEMSAHQFYRRLAEKTPLKTAKEAFSALAGEELEHIKRIQAELKKENAL